MPKLRALKISRRDCSLFAKLCGGIRRHNPKYTLCARGTGRGFQTRILRLLGEIQQKSRIHKSTVRMILRIKSNSEVLRFTSRSGFFGIVRGFVESIFDQRFSLQKWYTTATPRDVDFLTEPSYQRLLSIIRKSWKFKVGFCANSTKITTRKRYLTAVVSTFPTDKQFECKNTIERRRIVIYLSVYIYLMFFVFFSHLLVIDINNAIINILNPSLNNVYSIVFRIGRNVFYYLIHR